MGTEKKGWFKGHITNNSICKEMRNWNCKSSLLIACWEIFAWFFSSPEPKAQTCFFMYQPSFLYPATKVWRGIMLYPSVSVRPSVRPCSPFPIDNLSIYSRNFFKFCRHIVIGDEWYGIVNGQNPSIFNGVTALFRIGKMVSGLLFLYYS